MLEYFDFNRNVRYLDEHDRVQEAPVSALKDIPRVHKEPTLIKDIMPSMERGDRTKEQMTLIKLNEFNNMHRPNPSVMGSGIMISTSTGFWPNSYQPGQVF